MDVDVPPASGAVTVFEPFARPLSSPSNWPLARSANWLVTSLPLRLTVTADGSVPAGEVDRRQRLLPRDEIGPGREDVYLQTLR